VRQGSPVRPASATTWTTTSQDSPSQTEPMNAIEAVPTPNQTAYVAAPDVNAADLVAPVCRAADGAVLGEDDRAPRPIFDAMTDEVASRLVTVPDDRVLNVWEGGDPDGVAVVFRHGTPSGRLQAVLGAEAARRQGARLVSFNRPGYGRFRRHPTRPRLCRCRHAARDRGYGHRRIRRPGRHCSRWPTPGTCRGP